MWVELAGFSYRQGGRVSVVLVWVKDSYWEIMRVYGMHSRVI